MMMLMSTCFLKYFLKHSAYKLYLGCLLKETTQLVYLVFIRMSTSFLNLFYLCPGICIPWKKGTSKILSQLMMFGKNFFNLLYNDFANPGILLGCAAFDWLGTTDASAHHKGEFVGQQENFCGRLEIVRRPACPFLKDRRNE